MSRPVRILILCGGSAFLLLLVAFLVLAWRSRTADCVRKVVRFDVSAPGVRQSGAELVVIVEPVDTYAASPMHLSLDAGRSAHQVLFNPYSRENLNCTRVLESVDLVLEKEGKALAKKSLTYPKDFRRDEKGDYIAREPVVFEP